MSVTLVNEVTLPKEALNSNLLKISNNTVLFLDQQGVKLPIILIEVDKMKSFKDR